MGEERAREEKEGEDVEDLRAFLSGLLRLLRVVWANLVVGHFLWKGEGGGEGEVGGGVRS